MSVDYTYFMQGFKKEAEHLAAVYRGEVQEKSIDQSHNVQAIIPVLLRSTVTTDMRSLLLRQHIEIQGVSRDMQLADMTREQFYTFASETASREVKKYDTLLVSNDKQFQLLKQYLPEELSSEITKSEEGYALFRDELTNVIKSTLGIPEEFVVGSKEIEEYNTKQRRINS